MLNLCSDGHEEICFEGVHCPVCGLIDDHDKQIDDLNDKIEELEREESNE